MSIFLASPRQKPLVAGHGDVCSVVAPGSQSIFVNGNVRVGVGLETTAVLIHHFNA